MPNPRMNEKYRLAVRKALQNRRMCERLREVQFHDTSCYILIHTGPHSLHRRDLLLLQCHVHVR